MHTSLVIFRIYILVILLFLIFISIVISQEIFNILNTYLSIYKAHKFFFIENYSFNQIQFLINTYIQSKKWLLCIGFLEFCYMKKIIDSYTQYKILGYCYLQIYYFEISKYFYLKALIYEPLDINLLYNLIKIYDYLSDYKNACKYCNKILLFDSNNSFAKTYLLKYGKT